MRRYEFHLRIYSGQELKTLLGNAGFRDVRLHGALDDRPYGPYGASAERLIAIATKERERIVRLRKDRHHHQESRQHRETLDQHDRLLSRIVATWKKQAVRHPGGRFSPENPQG